MEPRPHRLICDLCTGRHPTSFCPKRSGFGLPELSLTERSVLGIDVDEDRTWDADAYQRHIERIKKARWREARREASRERHPSWKPPAR